MCLHTGKVNLKVSAEALKTDTLCGNEVATVPDMGQVDTVIRTLLVEVSDSTHMWFDTMLDICLIWIEVIED